MVARITGFVTRAQAGLVAPRSVSRNIDGDAGLTLHHGGSGKAPADHAGCLATWRSWQRYHMQTHGWADIAYSQGFCQHGYVLAGRGFGVRTAANGTNPGNQQSHAACWIGGAASTPTQQALDAADWLIAETRRLGGSTRVWAHSDWKSTSCPGDDLRRHARARDNTAIPTAAPTTPPAPTGGDQMIQHGDRGNAVRVVQQCLKGWNPKALPTYGVDEDYGDETREWVTRYQRAADLDPTGVVDGTTLALLVRYSPEVTH